MTGVVSAEFQQGETILLALAATAGDPSAVTSFEAKAKRSANMAIPADSAPVALTFTVTYRAAAGGVAAGFNLVGTGTLDPGIYCTNLKGVYAGATFKTDPLFFRITPSPT